MARDGVAEPRRRGLHLDPGGAEGVVRDHQLAGVEGRRPIPGPAQRRRHQRRRQHLATGEDPVTAAPARLPYQPQAPEEIAQPGHGRPYQRLELGPFGALRHLPDRLQVAAGDRFHEPADLALAVGRLPAETTTATGPAACAARTISATWRMRSPVAREEPPNLRTLMADQGRSTARSCRCPARPFLRPRL